MSLEEERLKAIREILLNHRGKADAITASTIGNALGIPENDTVSTTRKLITKLVKDGLPIGAHDNGYFLIENEDELNEYMQRLNGRIYGIYTRMNHIITNFNNYHGKSVKHIGDFDEGDEDAV
jgi:hypothetical protein